MNAQQTLEGIFPGEAVHTTKTGAKVNVKEVNSNHLKELAWVLLNKTVSIKRSGAGLTVILS